MVGLDDEAVELALKDRPEHVDMLPCIVVTGRVAVAKALLAAVPDRIADIVVVVG